MSDTQLKRIGGWSGLASGVLYLLAFIALVLFFALEFERALNDSILGRRGFYPFGFASDLLPVFAAGAYLVLVGVLYRLLKEAAPGWSLLGAVFGVVGALMLLLANLLFVLRLIPLGQQALFSFLAFAPIGIWLAIVNALARRSGLLSPRLSLWGMAVGIGEVLAVAGTIAFGGLPALSTGDVGLIGDKPALLISVSVAFLLGLLGNVLWPIGVGRGLLRAVATGD